MACGASHAVQPTSSIRYTAFQLHIQQEKLPQNGKALFDKLKELAIPDTQESKNKARLMIENFKMKKGESFEAATYRIKHLIIDYEKMGADCVGARHTHPQRAHREASGMMLAFICTRPRAHP